LGKKKAFSTNGSRKSRYADVEDWS
jgi:hypothetical protein